MKVIAIMVWLVSHCGLERQLVLAVNTLLEAHLSFSTSIGFDASAGAAVVAYRNSSGGQCSVLTVSGTSVSSGSAVTFNSSASTTNNNVVYDSKVQKTVIVYVDGGNSTQGTAIVGTVSGTSISFGSEVVFNAATTAQVGATFDSNVNRIVIAYSDGSSVGNFTTGIVSGTSITFGQTETQFAFNPFFIAVFALIALATSAFLPYEGGQVTMII